MKKVDKKKNETGKEEKQQPPAERIIFPKNKYSKLGGHLVRHLLDFWVVWAFLGVMLFLSLVFHWTPAVKCLVYLLAGIFVVYMLRDPMSAVYGLVGGSASIQTFLLNFFLITVIFSFVYWGLFFNNAGISYDGDNPQLQYAMTDSVQIKYDTVSRVIVEERITDSSITHQQVIQTYVDTVATNYHSISYWMVLKNSFLTSLTQGPSDFFFQVSDFGENMNTISAEKDKTALFSIILLLHVLISWLFLGVFISLLYSKFRYEA